MNSLSKLLTVFLSVLFTTTIFAQNFTVSGYITDEESGETIINGSVVEEKGRLKSLSNNFGFYSISLPKGKISIIYSYVGCEPVRKSFDLKNDTIINITLHTSKLLNEFVVLSNRSELGVKGTQMGAIEVPVEQLKNIPSIFGENDLIKALQLLPGVQSGTEGSAGLYVRGGTPDQNLLLLDGIPLYNVNHMFGFFSVFNTDAVKNVTLYKGAFPARYGERLSSVVDVRMKDGNSKRFGGNVSIGLISSKINLEGPIFSDKTTFNISARRTYLDLMGRLVMGATQQSRDDDKTGYYFYDLNAKITHKFSDKDKLFLSAYMGDDAVYMKNANSVLNAIDKNKSNMKWNWGNIVAALRWSHVVNSKLFLNTTASLTRYRSSLNINNESNMSVDGEKKKYISDITYKSGIQDLALRSEFDYSMNSYNSVKFGVNYTHHLFTPDVFGSSDVMESGKDVYAKDTVVGNNKFISNEFAIFLEDNITISRILKMNVGLRYSLFNVEKTNYSSLEPRLGIRVLANENLSFKAGYARMNQYVHLLSNSSVSLPTDLWVPTTKKIKPMKADQYSVGVFYNLLDMVDLSVEGYYKSMNNLIEYKDGASFMGASDGWENMVNVGRGSSYGVEFLAQRSFGNTTGWVAYTWSKTDRLFDREDEMINFGRPFPAKYDRRHDISTTITHKFNDRIDLSATWVYSTGNTGTIPLRVFTAESIPNDPRSSNYKELKSVEHRNNYRYNAYHRMDIGVNFHKKKKYGTRTWNISVYNLYNRKNPFLVMPNAESVKDANGNREVKQTLTQYSLFPIIPSISYIYKF